MKRFIDPAAQPILQRHHLDNFDALWSLQLDAVDEPNTERGGYSSVSRLELDGTVFYLKRQRNHLTRSLFKPQGEPTFAREMRNILHYKQRGIPALEAAYFEQRQVVGEHQALLLTYALEGWRDLDEWLTRWAELSTTQQQQIVQACAKLARTLHQAKQVHGCFYPKHIFLQQRGDQFFAKLIDLEKTRRLWLGVKDQIKDIEPLFRRTRHVWGSQEMRWFLHSYLSHPADAALWLQRLMRRRQVKDSR